MAFSDVFYTYTHSFDIVLLLGLVLSDGIHVFHFKSSLFFWSYPPLMISAFFYLVYLASDQESDNIVFMRLTSINNN